MRSVLSTLLGVGILMGLMAPAALADDVEEGAKIFHTRCYICHTGNDPYDEEYCKQFRSGYFPPPYGEDVMSVQNKFGPNLCGVFGAPAGRRSKEGFIHSLAFQKKIGTFNWTEENLDKWLTKTWVFIPGTWMFLKTEDPAERHKIIAFLKTYK